MQRYPVDTVTLAAEQVFKVVASRLKEERLVFAGDAVGGCCGPPGEVMLMPATPHGASSCR